MELTPSPGDSPGTADKSARKQGLETRLVATLLVTRIIDDNRNLDALCDGVHGLNKYLKLEPRDQSLARAIAVTALRHRTHIDAALLKLLDRAPPKRARFLIHSLHVAAAQILFLDLPDSAAVDIAVSAIGDDPRTSRFRSLANAVLRRMVREKDKFTSGITLTIHEFIPGQVDATTVPLREICCRRDPEPRTESSSAGGRGR